MQTKISWTLQACSRILRPVVRLSLKMGLKHTHLDRLLRDLLLQEATQILSREGSGRPNISQLSMATGINRKDVTARVRATDLPVDGDQLPPAAQAFTAWLQLAMEIPALRRIPIRKAPGVAPDAVSFESLAHKASRGNVHHRALLDDLIRLGMVSEGDGMVDLKADGYLPSEDLEYMLKFMADHTRDHLQAAVSNVLGDQPKMLERAVYADGLTLAEADRIHQLARLRWTALHHELVRELTLAVENSGEQGDQRVKVGIYTLVEAEGALVSGAVQERVAQANQN